MAATIMSRWLFLPRAVKQAQMRLFCFPYAGGGVSAFRDWVDLIPDFIELILVQLPGRESRFAEPPAQDLADIAQHVADAVGTLSPMPYATFGHSLGTLISYEFALEMCRREYPSPFHMVMSGRGAPNVERVHSATHRLSDNEFIETLRRLQGTPEEVLHDHELMRLLLPTLRADFALAENYRCGQPALLPCGLSVYGGVADSDVSMEHLIEWQKYTENPIVLRMFPGGHFFLHSSRYILLQALACDLRDQLDGTPQRRGVSAWL